MAQPYCICSHCNHLLTFNPHVTHLADQETSNTGFNVQSQQSTRWSPTQFQLLVLEELYRQGTKTSSSEQIQQIASRLRQFGKIEGKNVFYWFQNHKARERQKRRCLEMEETAFTEGLKGTSYEVKETKKWASTSNCSRNAEESAALDIAEKGSNWWTQFEERGIHVLRTDIAEMPAKCPNMEKPCLTPITTASTTYVLAHATHNTQLLTPTNYNLPVVLNRESFNYYDDEENAYPRTLELFPVKRDDQDSISHTERKSRFYAANAASMDTEITSKSPTNVLSFFL